jgi:hypothetical protein
MASSTRWTGIRPAMSDPRPPRPTTAQIAAHLGSVHPGLRALERLNDADLEKVCATTLLLNGNRLRELAGTDAADAVLTITTETLWNSTTITKVPIANDHV